MLQMSGRVWVPYFPPPPPPLNLPPLKPPYLITPLVPPLMPELRLSGYLNNIYSGIRLGCSTCSP